MMVTAIVPNYNHARFLRRRLESIYNQTCPNLRVILLDDASTDNSREILEEYRHHPLTQTIVYNGANSGSPFLQWQKGLSLVENEWVWIAESDDWCETNFLESLSEALSVPDCVLAYAQLYWADEGGEIIKNASPSETPAWYEGKAFVRDHLLGWNRLQNAGMLVFRLAAAKVASTNWIKMRQAGDFWLWAEIAAQGRVYGIGKALCYLTKHNQSTTANYFNTPLAKQEIRDTWLQMLRIGSIDQKDIQKKVLAEMVNLNLAQKRMLPEAYQQSRQEWLQFLNKAGLGQSLFQVFFLTWLTKWNFWIKTKKKYFSVY
jgi:glycosyltransferase involved in cell wall biosynthesis